jgi:hypothetical protein
LRGRQSCGTDPAVRVPPKKADDVGKNPFIDVFVHP